MRPTPSRLALLFVLSFTLVFTAAACDSGTEEEASRDTPASTDALFPADAEALWITDPASGNVVRIDALDPNVRTRIEVGGEPTSVAFSNGTVWLADGSALIALDAANADVEASIDLEVAVTEVAGAAGAAWALLPDRVVSLDPVASEAGSTVAVTDAVDATATETDLWIVRPGELLRVDPAGAGVRSSVATGIAQPAGLAVLDDRIMVVGSDGSVVAIDAEDGSIAAQTTLVVTHVPTGGVVATPDRLWVIDDAGQVIAVDPALEEAYTVELGSKPAAAALTTGTLWIVGTDAGTLTRIALDDLSAVEFDFDFSPADIAAG